MTVEIFTGTPSALKVRLEVLIAATSTINNVIVTSQSGVYIILWT